MHAGEVTRTRALVPLYPCALTRCSCYDRATPHATRNALLNEARDHCVPCLIGHRRRFDLLYAQLARGRAAWARPEDHCHRPAGLHVTSPYRIRWLLYLRAMYMYASSVVGCKHHSQTLLTQPLHSRYVRQRRYMPAVTRSLRDIYSPYPPRVHSLSPCPPPSRPTPTVGSFAGSAT